jgi:hypothetical protein
MLKKIPELNRKAKLLLEGPKELPLWHFFIHSGQSSQRL